MAEPNIDALALARVSPLIHFESCIKIEDKLKRPIRPRANVFQRRLFEAYETLLPIALSLGIQIRILGLKIRQCGGTTASVQIIYHHCQRFVADAVVMANIAANSGEMLRKIKYAATTDTFPWGNKLDPTRDKLEWQNGSRAELTSAETNKVGISRTRQLGLFSEACKYPRGGVKDDKAIMASMLPSLSGEGTLGIAESTPEGADGWFYEQYHGNKDQSGALDLDAFIAELAKGNRNPGNGWVKVFAAWFEFEENATEVPPEQEKEIMQHLTAREVQGISKYNWTVNQIAWRRAKLKSECGGSEALFDEYYPEDDITCFLSSGRPRFDMSALIAEENRSRGITWKEGTIDLQENGTVTWCENTSGWAPFKICEQPKIGLKYLVTCDPMTGEDQTESSNPDRHSIAVLRAEYFDGNAHYPEAVVARVKSPYFGEADEVGQYIEALSKYYGDCIVVLEINMGLHILEHLKARGVPVFQREVIDPYNRETPRKMFGFKTKDADTRRMLIDSLAIAIRDGTIHLNDQNIIDECKTFVVNKSGKAEARPGRKDDDVLAIAMGHYAIGAATTYVQQVRRRRKPADWKRWRGWQ
jgi:hypothetical protein